MLVSEDRKGVYKKEGRKMKKRKILGKRQGERRTGSKKRRMLVNLL